MQSGVLSKGHLPHILPFIHVLHNAHGQIQQPGDPISLDPPTICLDLGGRNCDRALGSFASCDIFSLGHCRIPSVGLGNMLSTLPEPSGRNQ
jgi:hypothetical protein